MFESYLGEDGFRDGLRLHMQRYPHSIANVENFMKSLADGSGRPDVVPAFRSFLDQPGVPLAAVSLDCSAAEPRVVVRQSRYLPIGSRGDPEQTWQLPLCLRVSVDGELTKECSLLTAAETTLTLAGASACPDFVMPNADGAGYYRFALDEDGWRKLMAGFDTLNQKEALAVADSLSAAFQADRLSTAAFLDSLRIVAASPYSQVAIAPAKDLARISDKLVSVDRRAAVQAMMRDIYRPRLAALDADQEQGAAAVDRALLRTKLVNVLAIDAKDPALRAELVAQAERFVIAGDEAAVDPALLPTALAVGVQELGEPFALALVDRILASNDMKFRNEAAASLAATDDVALGDQLRALLLDDRLRGREPTTMAFAMAGRESQRRAIFDWFKENEAAFTADMSQFGTRFLPNMGAGFCTTVERDEVEAYFSTVVDKWQGASRSLAEVLEGVELCTALREARGAELDAYFAS